MGATCAQVTARASADIPARGLGRRGARGWASGGGFCFEATWAGGRGRSGAPVGPTNRATAWAASCAPGRNVGGVGKMRRAAPHPMTGGPAAGRRRLREERGRALLEGGGRARLLGAGNRAAGRAVAQMAGRARASRSRASMAAMRNGGWERALGQRRGCGSCAPTGPRGAAAQVGWGEGQRGWPAGSAGPRGALACGCRTG
jgi:hypothetical protein